MWLASLFGLLGSGLKGLFGLKKAQGDVIRDGIKVVAGVNMTDSEVSSAAGSIISAENRSGSWLAATWRPLMMVTFLGIIISYWFGYVPPKLLDPTMPPMIAEIFSLIKIGMGGYIGGRTLEKIVSSINLGPIIKKYIEKKFV